MNAVRTAIGVGVLAFLIEVGLVGCGKDPVRPKIEAPFQYPALDTPEHVLMNVKYAWERRDSTRTGELYDHDYVGTAPNPYGTPPFLSFNRADEVHIVANLHNDSAVTVTAMELRAESTWVQLHNGSDPPDYRTIQLLKGVSLDVMTTSTIYEASTSLIEYTFKPYVTGADTTWKIIRWIESF